MSTKLIGLGVKSEEKPQCPKLKQDVEHHVFLVHSRSRNVTGGLPAPAVKIAAKSVFYVSPYQSLSTPNIRLTVSRLQPSKHA
jgi:hypothetical protein